MDIVTFPLYYYIKVIKISDFVINKNIILFYIILLFFILNKNGFITGVTKNLFRGFHFLTQNKVFYNVLSKSKEGNFQNFILNNSSNILYISK